MKLNWDDLKTVLEIARAGSISAAAHSLSLNHATVSRRLKSIEQKLGHRLFEDRCSDGYKKTVLGDVYIKTALNMEREMLALDMALASNEKLLTEQIRLTIPPPTMKESMAAIGVFHKSNPAIDIAVTCTYDILNLTRREADIAIRYTEAPPEHLVGRRLGKIAFSAYANVAHNSQNSDFQNEISWLGWNDGVSTPQWFSNSNSSMLSIRHQFGDPYLQLEAARSGLGIAWLPCYMGDRERDLTRVTKDDPIVPPADLWILSHQELRDSPSLRMLTDTFVNYFHAIENSMLGILW